MSPFHAKPVSLLMLVALAGCGGVEASSPDASGGDAAAEPDAPIATSAPTIFAGFEASCSVRPSGHGRCWGNNNGSQLGHGDSENLGDDEAPASAGDIPVPGTLTQVVIGIGHACSLDVAGVVRCWGQNGQGQLGYGNTTPILDPAQAPAVDVGGPVAAITVATSSTCALLTSGAVRCWGDNSSGGLGYGVPEMIGDDETPADRGDVPLGARATAIAAGVFHICAILEGGALRCWGRAPGIPGTDGIGDDETPDSLPVIDVGAVTRKVRGGTATTCAILDQGRLRCWGNNDLGQLGYGHNQRIGDDEPPASAGDVPVDGEVVDIAMSRDTACAVLADGAVRCWGGGAPMNGVPGAGAQSDAALAVTVDVGAPALAIASHRWHFCALLTTGAVRCWGQSTFGPLGYPGVVTAGDDETPAMLGDVPLD